MTTFGNEQVKLLRSKLSFQDETIAQLQRDDDMKEEEKTKLKGQIEKLSSELQSQSECNGNLNTKVYTSVQAENRKNATTTFLDAFDLKSHMAGHFFP